MTTAYRNVNAQVDRRSAGFYASVFALSFLDFRISLLGFVVAGL
jgi:hypothetical protein